MNGLDRESTAPLWRQLQGLLLRRIEGGEFANRFPGELALAEEYGVSRQTVRQALRELRAGGILVAERGRQPRVAPPAEITQPVGALYSLFAAVEAAGLKQYSVVRTLDVRADAVVAERLGLEASAPLLYLERLRLAGDEPLALDRVWLPAELAEPLLDADFQHTSLYGELFRRAGLRLDHGCEQIRAVIPTAAERAQLRCDEQAAALSISRLGTASRRPVEWRHTLVRGDRFALTAEFSGRVGYRLLGSRTEFVTA
nr:GntR family transcriptional regulator [Amycolatopsis acididurans]